MASPGGPTVQDQFLVWVAVAFDIAVLTVIIGGIIWLERIRRRRRDARRAARWEAARARCDEATHLAIVRPVYQRARRGSKAIIEWTDTGIQQDAWFSGWHPSPGVILLLRGGVGWGPHNRNPNVFYTTRESVLAVLPGDSPAAWQRHRTREQRRHSAS